MNRKIYKSLMIIVCLAAAAVLTFNIAQYSLARYVIKTDPVSISVKAAKFVPELYAETELIYDAAAGRETVCVVSNGGGELRYGIDIDRGNDFIMTADGGGSLTGRSVPSGVGTDRFGLKFEPQDSFPGANPYEPIVITMNAAYPYRSPDAAGFTVYYIFGDIDALGEILGDQSEVVDVNTELRYGEGWILVTQADIPQLANEYVVCHNEEMPEYGTVIKITR